MLDDVKAPEIKLMSISNVFCRLMHFKNKGDIEKGHKHNYDHGTLVSSGSVLVEQYNDNNELINSREFYAPTFIFIKKDFIHKLTALEDNTVCACVHALRTLEGNILSTDFLIEQETDKAEAELNQIMYQRHPYPEILEPILAQTKPVVGD